MNCCLAIILTIMCNILTFEAASSNHYNPLTHENSEKEISTKKICFDSQQITLNNTLLAAISGDLEIIKAAVPAYISVNVKNSHLFTLLHLAVFHHHSTMVKYLCEQHADVNAQAKMKMTPLYLAAVRNNAEIIRILLNHDADPNIPNQDGKTPHLIATQLDHINALQALEDWFCNWNLTEEDVDLFK